MLTHLFIKNYVLIEELEMAPHQAFNVITGETGAGKSIMLGAIGLLLGNRADRKTLFNEEEKCIIEGTFNISAYHIRSLFEEEGLDYDETTIIRREISANGKSRAFINDTPVNLETLQVIGKQLIDIHSQHDNLLLGTHSFQLVVVDAYANHTALITQYQQLFEEYKKRQRYFEKLMADSDRYRKELDYNSFLLEELREVNLRIGEQEELENDLKILENAEEIGEKLSSMVGLLSDSEFSVSEGLRQAVNTLAQLGKIAGKFETYHERLESCWIELKDLIGEIESEAEGVEVDPQTMAEIQERLSTIYDLQKKHKVNTEEELIAIQEELAQKVDKVLNFDEEIEALQKQLQMQESQLRTLAVQISEKRKSIIPSVESDLTSLFGEVGMPNATIKIIIEPTELTIDGIDKISLLFSANRGIPPQEIKQVASGGEFSRLMLCIKYVLAGKTALPTIIFDEIDTGISGEIALKVGKMMKEMSSKHQVIAISHLHQIAAKGDSHYFVYKRDTPERTISNIKMLTPDERIREIAQMISGAEPSESAILSAKELLAVN